MKMNVRKSMAMTAAGVAVAATAGLSVISTAESASAYAVNCRGGYNTATTAWGRCDVGPGPAQLNGFRLVVNCYYYPQRVSYGVAGNSIYASCPSWSHVTGIYVQPWTG